MEKSVLKKFLLPVFLALAFFKVDAQFVNSGVTISQTRGVVMAIQDINVENNGDWINDGVLTLSNNWTGFGTYRFGQLNLIGGDQRLESDFASIDELYIQGGGTKTFNQNVAVSNQLHLEEGFLILENESLLTILQDGEIVGGGASSFVSGDLYQFGAGDLHYPIGFNEEYRPVTLIGVSAGQEAIGLQTQETTLETGPTLTEITNDRSWELKNTSGRTIEGITLPVLDQEYISTSTDIVFAFSNNLDPFEALLGGEFDGSMEIATFSLNQNVSSGVYTLGKLSSVDPPIMVVNVVTANNDGKHDYLRIENIDFYEGNHVEIYNRAGQKVFEMSDYDNRERVFSGIGNVGNSGVLLTGSYFYSIKLGKKKVETGFIYVKTQ